MATIILSQHAKWKVQFQRVSKAPQKALGNFEVLQTLFNLVIFFIIYPTIFQQKSHIALFALSLFFCELFNKTAYAASPILYKGEFTCLWLLLRHSLTIFSPFLYENVVYLSSFLGQNINQRTDVLCYLSAIMPDIFLSC